MWGRTRGGNRGAHGSDTGWKQAWLRVLEEGWRHAKVGCAARAVRRESRVGDVSHCGVRRGPDAAHGRREARGRLSGPVGAAASRGWCRGRSRGLVQDGRKDVGQVISRSFSRTA
ncbi:hypothetical protein Arub01_00770 [Actinomadura rubrobrunea]|uniref:Uncharacterized protein n=1 Tax=Actinomadura rubrobrunea TaxID=115335 RepID=A0A9W6UTJ5_9ACTN|nr:hypothetical protein Arub01_00770 [Actinomadura rubrobrunea]